MNQETTAAATVSDACQDAGARQRCKSIVPEYLEELVGNNSESQNWKGMAIALFVILAVCGLVALSVFLLTPDVQTPIVPKVSLKDIMDEKWKLSKHVWVGSDLVFTDVAENVVKMSVSDDEPELFIPKEVIKGNGIQDYDISKNQKYALLIYNKVSIYTFSYNASCYIYDIRTRTKEPLVHEQSVTVFQYCGFGPRGNVIVYSFNGDLFYKTNVREKAKRLTPGGKFGIHQFGMADWIYEEEILETNVAHWWSPNGQYLAYASFDDGKVRSSYVTFYGGPTSEITSYKRIEKYKYPKAGGTNPVVNLHVVDVNTMEQITFIKPTLHRQRLDTFHSLTWLNDGELLITWSNRTMSASVIQQCFPTIATCVNDVVRRSVLGTRLNSNQGWLTNLNQRILRSGNSDVFFYIYPSDHGAMGEYNHLALVNKTEKPSSIKLLTKGNWEVTKLLHYDASTKDIYYISNERYSGSRHVYRINPNGDKKCLTCNLEISALSPYVSEPLMNQRGEEKTAIGEDLTCGEENKCRYYDASFGSRSDWLLVQCLGPCLPFSGILRLPKKTISRGDGVEIEEFVPQPSLEILAQPTPGLSRLLPPLTRYGSIYNEGVEIKIKMLLPAAIHVGKRPVVFFKGDVGSQTVDFRFRLDLATYIVTNIGAVGVFVDGRGSGKNGEQQLQSVAGRPGKLEIEDMKAVLKYLEPKVNMDVLNVGVVGTSGYGGYVAALSLTQPEFRCGVSRPLVSDWKLYNSFGAERIMGSPIENPLLYQKNNLLHLIEGISNSRLRIYHGMQDRRVNIQHSVLLEESAMLSDLPLDSVKVSFPPNEMLNPEKGRKIESNVYESIAFFLRNCLFGNSEAGKLKLDLLNTNYGIPT